MTLFRSLPATALALFLIAPCGAQQVGGEPAWPTEEPASTGFHALDKLAPLTIDAPAPSATALAALRSANQKASMRRIQLGIEQATGMGDTALGDALAWHMLADGRSAARLVVHSPGAAALRTALDLRSLPDGASLRVAEDASGMHGMVELDAKILSLQRRQDSTVWTPVTAGDTQHIELLLPAGADPRWVRLAAPRISWLVVDPARSLDPEKIGDSDACEIDVACVSNPSAAFNNVRRAVTRMVFQDGGSFFCTGTLLNDSDTSTQIPWIFGAAHCFTQQSVANTLTTFWFYEATGCGVNQLSSASRQVAGGATIRFADEASDVLFYRLNGQPPGGVFYLGWDAGTVSAGSDIVVVHHPAGDVMKVSLGRVTGIGPSSLASGSFIKAGYTSGTTEGGSSGCGLLTSDGSQFFLRGGLLGGSASCANTGAINTPGNSDDYSRFDLVFPQLRQFLFPSSSEPPSSTDFTGAWNNAAEDGWGMVVVRGDSGTYAMYIYHYDQDNSSGWYLSFGDLSGTRYSADLFAFRGPWFGAPPFNPQQVVPRTAGTLTVTFNSATRATVSFTIDGRTVNTTLDKLAF